MPTANALAHARLIGVYVSASWCGPCRTFTPQLADFYKVDKTRSFEIIFASLDRDEASFTDYFTTMPWTLALPYGAGEAFASKHSVRGVPTLLLFTSDGTLVSTKGVEGLSRAAAGQGPPFPWIAWGGDKIGAAVKIVGLEKRADLNGQAGIVVGATQDTERYSVKIAGTNEVIAVRAVALGKPWGSDLIGKTRTLGGLKSRADLNGARVHVCSGEEKAARFSTLLLSGPLSGEIISVRRENLDESHI